MREIPPGGVRRSSRTHHRPHVQGHESSHDDTGYHQIRTNKDKDVPTVVDTHYICILFILPVDLDLPVQSVVTYKQLGFFR